MTISHVAFFNLQNPFLEIWKRAQTYHFFELGDSGSLSRVYTNSFPDQRSLNVVGI